MKFQLDFQLPPPEEYLEHGGSVVLLGSCFSDNLAPRFENAGFKVCSNPLGTIFHPTALSNGIIAALSEFQSQAVNHNDLWFDWRASGVIYSTSRESLDEKMKVALKELKQSLSEAKLLVVTFGTAWGYELNSGELVANCHKMPSTTFTKKLIDLNNLLEDWKDVIQLLKELNPNLKIVFTVSPVRHSKDGLIENNRSKARLIQLCEKLEEYGDYFPSYELVIDVLRDHRFFEADLVHPNSQAIDFIWEQAKLFFFSEKTLGTVKEVEAINKMRNHKSMYPESQKSREFSLQVEAKKLELSKANPNIYWKNK